MLTLPRNHWPSDDEKLEPSVTELNICVIFVFILFICLSVMSTTITNNMTERVCLPDDKVILILPTRNCFTEVNTYHY